MKTSSSRLEHPSLAMMSKIASMLAWLLDNVSSSSTFKYFLFRLIIDSLWQITRPFIIHWRRCTVALLLNFLSTCTEIDTLVLFLQGTVMFAACFGNLSQLQYDFPVITLNLLYIGEKTLLLMADFRMAAEKDECEFGLLKSETY